VSKVIDPKSPWGDYFLEPTEWFEGRQFGGVYFFAPPSGSRVKAIRIHLTDKRTTPMLIDEMNMAQLTSYYNSLGEGSNRPGVTRFKSLTVGRERVRALLAELGQEEPQQEDTQQEGSGENSGDTNTDAPTSNTRAERAPRENTNKMRALNLLNDADPDEGLHVNKLIAGVYGEGNTVDTHKTALSGVLRGVQVALDKEGSRRKLIYSRNNKTYRIGQPGEEAPAEEVQQAAE
jgi:hypothetical protein